MMMNVYFRTTSRTATGLGRHSEPYTSLRTPLSTHLYQFRRLGPIRHFEIRQVITSKPQTKRTIKGLPHTYPPKNTQSGEQPPESSNGPLEQGLSAPLQQVEYTPYVGDIANVDVDKWLSSLVLPSDNYWDHWKPTLKDTDVGGLATAQKFVGHWKNSYTEVHIHVQKHKLSKGQRKVFMCTTKDSLPLLGDWVVDSYGYSKKEAYANRRVARISALYRKGKLDTIYEGTFVSRKFLEIYLQAARYGLIPRFKISLSNDQPDAHYQITLAVPEWRVKAQSSAPTYIEALSAVIETYQATVRKHGVKTRLSREATRDRLDILSYGNAERALQFLIKKLEIKNFRYVRRKLDTLGPQWQYWYVIQANKDDKPIYSTRNPTIRKLDARFAGTITTVVRVLQCFGFDAIDGFKEEVEAARNCAIESVSSHGDEIEGVDSSCRIESERIPLQQSAFMGSEDHDEPEQKIGEEPAKLTEDVRRYVPAFGD